MAQWLWLTNFGRGGYSGSLKMCVFRHRRNDDLGPSKGCLFDCFLTSFLVQMCVDYYQMKALGINAT